jgi:hypothetical protein
MLHQPFGLTLPATLRQAFGGSKSEQLLHFLLPFGRGRYATADCGNFAAIAASVPIARTVAMPLTHATPRHNIDRRDISAGPSLELSFITRAPMMRPFKK